MSRLLKNWLMALVLPRPLVGIIGLPRYFRQYLLYKRLSRSKRVAFTDTYPCLTDGTHKTPFDPHYFYQAAWVSRRLHVTSPSLHVDIGSSVMMINVLSASVKTVFVDYRPLQASLTNLISLAGDVVRLPFRDASIASLSCLHVIEHVGLGRYGDPLDPAGSQLAAAELQRVLQPGGTLFLSAPVGRERVCFNAHRVHAPSTIQSYFQTLRLEAFSLVDDVGQFQEHASHEAAASMEYGCGLFEFVKARV